MTISDATANAVKQKYARKSEISVELKKKKKKEKDFKTENIGCITIGYILTNSWELQS